MRALLLFLAGLLFTIISFAQGTVSGTVVSKSSHAPLSNASIFLSNSSFGTASAQDGSFTLRGVKPGQYELVISMVGYEDYVQTIMVGKEPLKINAEMSQKVTELREVIITSGGNWKKNYENFLRDFLGTSADAKKCKILNPKDINLINHKTKRYLEGYSYDFIDMDNYALGYKVRILLKEFKSDALNRIISWQGKVLFQEMNGNAEQKKKWEDRRREVYYGSSMHFYRSLMSDRLDDDGYKLMILQRRPNLNRPSEELIQKKLDRFQYQVMNRDSLKYWADMENLPKYDEKLIRTPIRAEQVARRTDVSGVYALTFPECLYVIYTKRHETFDFKDLYRPLDMENFETSVITLYKPYALFDSNGTVISNGSTLYEGSWTLSKAAELLPVDYSPEDAKANN
ncbi:carboxypeptidase-like regulatory domain-containing protein [Mucilaginibacter sp. KACC 22063]|uniref:carboxypeptidase-like regulatory domain-containing protein n=1 Tax=Mucilaginibacter sp. KACC 22063 TaxID=3025666 RepID=UPI0023672F77|nr:carboxypeptidase-like regulatory domain-containing protein [Mucilaginibacter sp. KACC 22063]WDF57067.1 carboxypeptidase-like regulatory domain-containing protein [Mucilaginibacter sp. KACC 22063]